MTILALVDKTLVDLKGSSERYDQEIKQGIPHDRIHKEGKFQDLGLVVYAGMEYYASLYIPYVEPDEDE